MMGPWKQEPGERRTAAKVILAAGRALLEGFAGGAPWKGLTAASSSAAIACSLWRRPKKMRSDARRAAANAIVIAEPSLCWVGPNGVRTQAELWCGDYQWDRKGE